MRLRPTSRSAPVSGPRGPAASNTRRSRAVRRGPAGARRQRPWRRRSPQAGVRRRAAPAPSAARTIYVSNETQGTIVVLDADERRRPGADRGRQAAAGPEALGRRHAAVRGALRLANRRPGRRRVVAASGGSVGRRHRGRRSRDPDAREDVPERSGSRGVRSFAGRPDALRVERGDGGDVGARPRARRDHRPRPRVRRARGCHRVAGRAAGVRHLRGDQHHRRRRRSRRPAC